MLYVSDSLAGQILDLVENFQQFVFQYGAPAPEEVRAMIHHLLEGEVPSQEVVDAATHAMERAWENYREDDCMEEEEIPTTDDDPHWIRWYQSMDKEIQDGED